MKRLFYLLPSLLFVPALTLAGCQGGTPGTGGSAAPAATATPNDAYYMGQDYQEYLSKAKSGMFAAPSDPRAKLVASIAAKLEPEVTKLNDGKPFGYYVEKEPLDAESYFGPRVYISTGMVDFADNQEEIAGVLCHESGHVLHHDGIDSDRAQHNKLATRIEALSHRHGTTAKLLQAMANLRLARFTQAQEESADKAGADVCAASGSNPWGIVWMLRKFQSPEGRKMYLATKRFSLQNYLADHPTNQKRISALARYLKSPGFQIFHDEIAHATPK